jgi:hypothetical protein
MFGAFNSADSFLTLVHQIPDNLWQGFPAAAAAPGGSQEDHQQQQQQGTENRAGSGSGSTPALVGQAGATPFSPTAVERSVSSSSGLERESDMAGRSMSDLSMHLLSLSLLEPNVSAERLDSGAMWQHLGGYDGFWSPGPARGGNRAVVGTPQSRHVICDMDVADFLTTPPASRAASSRWAMNVFSPFSWRQNPPAAAAGGDASAEPAAAAAAGGESGGESSIAAVMGLLGPPNSSFQQQQQQQQAAPSQQQQQHAAQIQQQQQQQYLPLSMLPPAGTNRSSSSHRLSSMGAQGPSSRQSDRAVTHQQQGLMLPPPPQQQQQQQQQQQAMYPSTGGYNLSNLIPWGQGGSSGTALLEGAAMDVSGGNVLSTGGVLSSAGHLIHMAADPAAQGPTVWWVQPAGLVPGHIQDRTTAAATATAGVIRPPAAVPRTGVGVGVGVTMGAAPGTQQQQQQQQQMQHHSQYVQDL